MKQGVPWQSTLGIELAGKTLGLLGFGKLGSKVGEYRQGDRHEPDRLEREPPSREGQGRRRRAGIEAGPVPSGSFFASIFNSARARAASSAGKISR